MIVSHKHKFIFVKTHKTATQTFLKFIKPHLGPDDVMAGDPGNERNEDTKINVDKIFPDTGKCAADYQEVYGNHLPWFMIKDIVGDNIWNEYTKFTIEREPYDRILSLFYFMNPVIIRNDLLCTNEYKDEIFAEQEKNWHEKYQHKPKTEHPMVQLSQWQKDNTMLTVYPDEVRSYFEEWLLVQLESLPLPLTDDKTYGVSPHVDNPYVQKEKDIYKQTAQKFSLNKILGFHSTQNDWVDERAYKHFPYLKERKVKLPAEFINQYSHILGQCRFLNYGNYFDGEKVHVDHVVDFKNVGDNIGRFFNKYNIDIKCDKNLYNAATQNAHYRKNVKGKQPKEWWYNGPRGEWLHKVIKRRFYNDDMNENQINFNKIIAS